jgi:hypothetical protein
MIDDIVTRLRREAVEEGFSNTDWTQLSFDVQNACDEIERLRLDVKDLRNVIQLLKEADND